MDLLTHTLLTHKLIGKQPGILLAGVGPDVLRSDKQSDGEK
jgi:hypothetical protein